jgi:TolA-binding protein
MSFWDQASRALAETGKLFLEVNRLTGVLQQIEARITDFRDETRKRLLDVEARIDQRSNAVEQRLEQRVTEVERRNRDLESRMAELEGMTKAAMAEAWKNVLLHNSAEAAKVSGAQPLPQLPHIKPPQPPES